MPNRQFVCVVDTKGKTTHVFHINQCTVFEVTGDVTWDNGETWEPEYVQDENGFVVGDLEVLKSINDGEMTDYTENGKPVRLTGGIKRNPLKDLLHDKS